MAHKKASGSTAQHKSRAGKRRGIKKFGSQKVTTGMILVRQKGTKFFPGDGVGMGRDFTLFAKQDGTVKFKQKLGKKIITVV